MPSSSSATAQIAPPPSTAAADEHDGADLPAGRVRVAREVGGDEQRDDGEDSRERDRAVAADLQVDAREAVDEEQREGEDAERA